MEEEDEVPEAVPMEEVDLGLRRRLAAGADPVPVTIVTGFLGAGKTTLVNHVLTTQHGLRVAVILNEFGEEVGIERNMLRTAEGETAVLEEWVELANGCVCCSVKGDLVQALEALLQRQDRLDHILLETTGLANPGPVAAMLWVDTELEAAVRLDSVVTVVDARNLRRQLREPRAEGTVNEAALQIAYADTILLNKVDLLDAPVIARADEPMQASKSGTSEKEASCNSKPAKVATESSEVASGVAGEDHRGGSDLARGEAGVLGLEQEIRSLNSMARIIRSVRCQVSIQEVLQRGSYDPKRAAEVDAALTGIQDEGDGAAGGHRHDTAVGTVSFQVAGQVDLRKVDDWLGRLLWEHADSADVYRLKGVLNAYQREERYIFQAVHELFEVNPGKSWEEHEDRLNRVVAIGQRLDKARLLHSFSECLVSTGG